MEQARSVLAGVMLISLSVANAEPLQILAAEYPPYTLQTDGRISGITADKAQALLVQAGLVANWQLMPWRRAYRMALEHPGVCLLNTLRTPEREALFYWVGPLIETSWVLFGRAGQPALGSLTEARGKLIGTFDGDARDQYLRRHGFRVAPAAMLDSNPRKLALGRIDLWIEDSHVGYYQRQRLGLGAALAEVYRFQPSHSYLACQRDTAPVLVRRLQQAFVVLEANGHLARIDQRYAHWRAPPVPHSGLVR